jgi:hypothetical protein
MARGATVLPTRFCVICLVFMSFEKKITSRTLKALSVSAATKSDFISFNF